MLATNTMVKPAAEAVAADAAKAPAKVVAREVNVYYGDKHALKSVSVDIPS